MEHNDFIDHLRSIVADPDYIRWSRATIISTEPARRLSPWRMFVQSMQFGGAVTLASILVILVIGGFSTWKFLSPFRLASLDPAGLRAEAQAVDVQIELTNVGYVEPSAAETTARAVTSIDRHAARIEQLSKNLGLIIESSSAPTAVSIDEALDRLAE